MMNTDRYTQEVWVDGWRVSAANVANVLESDAARTNAFRAEVLDFLAEWFSDNPLLLVHSSGSTGQPKPMWVEKERMMASAVMTCSFLDIPPGATALLCMSMQYIAGKMMVVRALVAGLKLITVKPCGHPLKQITEAPYLAAMVPLQVYNTLRNPVEMKRLKQVRELLIGGGHLNMQDEIALRDFPNRLWATYGMTETLSHVALRSLNGATADSWYFTMPQVRVYLNEDGVLCFHAPLLNESEVVTNDLGEVRSDGRFRVFGRRDNIINSGGIKIQIEVVEQYIRFHLRHDFQITAVPHPKLGEEMVMLINTERSWVIRDFQKLISLMPRFWQPAKLIYVDELPRTETGKPARAVAKKLALEKIQEGKGIYLLKESNL